MKKSLLVLLAITIVFGCAKDADVNEAPVDENVISIFAEMPEMEAAKAIADGSFSWQSNDEIAIPITGGYAVFRYNATSGKFIYTPTGDEEFISGKAYYPASSRPGGDYSTSFANGDAARAGFKMEADYTVGAESISFTHKSSLINLNFFNVPSFATSVRVKAGDDVVATVALSSPSENLTVKVPVTPNGSKSYKFALMDGNNVLKEVSKTASLTAGTYYTTPDIRLNYMFSLTDNSGWTGGSTYPALYISDGSNNKWYCTNQTGDAKLNVAGDGTLYVFASESWMTEGSTLAVKFQTEPYNSSHTSETSIVLRRSIHFTVPSGGGMRARYRTYVWLSDSQRQYWDANPVQIKETQCSGAVLSGQADMTEIVGSGGSYFYYENSEAHYGWQVTFVAFNKSNTAWSKSKQYILNKDEWLPDL